MQADQKHARFLALTFVFFSVNLFTAIVLTIRTTPGHIPEETEWDMPEDFTLPRESSNSNLLVRDSNISDQFAAKA